MRQFYFLLLLLFSLQLAQAQIVNIPDANFKNALTNTLCVDTDNDGLGDATVDTNEDGEIQLTEALNVVTMLFESQNITGTTGLEAFLNLENLFLEGAPLTTLDVTQNVNLVQLSCSITELTSLDVTQNPNLVGLDCGGAFLSEIDVTQNPNLKHLSCYGNTISILDLSQNPELETLYTDNNNLTSLDLSNNTKLKKLWSGSNLFTTLDLSNNSLLEQLYLDNCQLTSLFLKNGSILQSEYFQIQENPDLAYICIDEMERDFTQSKLDEYGYTNCSLSSYCTFSPGGETFSVVGQCVLDINLNGCDGDDLYYPNLKFNISNGAENTSFVSNLNGFYDFEVVAGMHTITPQFENPNYFSISPTSYTVAFPETASPFVQDFCITPNGTINDLEITLIPINQARPGFDADYKIIYKNKGTTTLSGEVSFDYLDNDGLMELLSTTPTADSHENNIITWNYTNLKPFESKEILITFHLNTPTETPPLNGGDPLGFVANIYPLDTDETLSDNNFQLKQIVVNSFDPNDKTCLEGETIKPEQVGEFVHYMIRFENTGTASAINIVVKDEIDITKYDVSTLIPLDASHDFITTIKEDNFVEFIFENINLPFDDANNDGYVLFKIKTLPTLVLGDTFENDAEIYFDYNFPIITNNEQTTVAESLSIDDFDSQTNIQLYPNPVQDVLNINVIENINVVSIYSVNGKLLQEVKWLGANRKKKQLQVGELSAGIYIVKVKTDKRLETFKIIKN
ncbi:DUF7619 domain-containing protein [Lacinutrix himadriensis]|uniref:DUF7619 domain-containing protein n=1 Tax=Lacinutrix himadriensis TaxID=641549 RepID=UPI0006E41752|nr:T9SS type A sorting domain-containing protein [Lacinutrix himadriensis]